jgi:AcrR family transcriptional regulator
LLQYVLMTEKPNESKAKASNKRQLILDAALALFDRRGFDGTTVPEIAREAGVATGTIYRYFKDKQALGNALYRHWRAVWGGLALSPAPASLQAEARFTRLWHRLTLFARSNPAAMRFLELHHHGGWLDAESHAADATFTERLIQFFDEARTAGAIRPMPPALAAALTLGAAAGLAKFTVQGALAGDAATAGELGDAVWRAISA